MQYRSDLDGLRAIAVTLVVFYHATFPPPGGFLGVDVFFTLSGFLITSQVADTLNENNFSLRTFYIKRSLRLLPAAATTVAIASISAVALLPHASAVQTTNSAIAAIFSVSNVRYLLQAGYFDSSAKFKPLLHTWSLAVEEQFYLFWPPLLVFFHYRVGRHAALSFALLVVFVSPFLSQYLLSRHPAAAFYVAPARFYELLLGAALAYAPPCTSTLESNSLGLLGVVGLAISVTHTSANDAFPGWRALGPCLATAALIRAGPHAFVSRLLSWRPLTFVGRISYSVYLVHWPVIVFYRLIAGQQGAFGLGEKLFMVTSAFLLGYPLNILVEKRFRISRGRQDTEQVEACSANAEQEEADFGTDVEKTKSPSTVLDSHGDKVDSAGLKCRRLFGLIICLQSLLFILAYGLNTVEHRRTLQKSGVQPPDTGESFDAVRDDYNGVDLEAVFRLEQDCGNSKTRRKIYTGDTGPRVGTIYRGFSVPTKEAEAVIPRVLLLGDSHAQHWSCLAFALSREFRVDVEVWVSPGCAPVLNVHNMYVRNEASTKRCAKHIAGLQEALEQEQFDTVILSARWSILVHDGLYGDRSRRPHVLLKTAADEANVKRNAPQEKWDALYAESRELFRRSLRETVEVVRAIGSRVVLFNQVPHLLTDPTGCTTAPGARAVIEAGKQPERCVGVTRVQAVARLQFTADLMREIQHEVSGVTVVLPSEAFCDNFLQDEAKCRAVLGDRLLYADSGHLARLGAAFFAKRWESSGWGGVEWRYRREADSKEDSSRLADSR